MIPRAAQTKKEFRGTCILRRFKRIASCQRQLDCLGDAIVLKVKTIKIEVVFLLYYVARLYYSISEVVMAYFSTIHEPYLFSN